MLHDECPYCAVTHGLWTLQGRLALAWLPKHLHEPFLKWLEKQPSSVLRRYESDYHSVLREFFDSVCRPSGL